MQLLRSKDSSSSVPSLERLGCREDMREISAQILFQFFLQEALVSSSGMSRDVHSLMLSILHFLCRLQHRSPSKMPWRMVLERLSWRVTCPNHASFPLLDSFQKCFLWTHKEVELLRTQSLVLCPKYEIRRSFLMHLVSKSWTHLFTVSKQGPCFTAVEEDGADKEACRA